MGFVHSTATNEAVSKHPGWMVSQEIYDLFS